VVCVLLVDVKYGAFCLGTVLIG